MTDIAALVEEARKFHAEIVESDGGECDHMRMMRELCDALERLQRERDAAIGANSVEQRKHAKARKRIEELERERWGVAFEINKKLEEVTAQLSKAKEYILKASYERAAIIRQTREECYQAAYSAMRHGTMNSKVLDAIRALGDKP